MQGTTGDYLVVYGMPDTMDEPSKKWYYATSKSLTLKQFPDLTEPFAKLASTISGRFLGNPAKLLGPDADAAEEADEVRSLAAASAVNCCTRLLLLLHSHIHCHCPSSCSLKFRLFIAAG